MNLPVKKTALRKALVIPSSIAVIVLAVLLYRWSNQISEATTVRLADSLQMSMVNWHLDFFRNLSEICLAMKADLGAGATGDLTDYADRFVEWKAAAGYPELVKNVYLLRLTEAASPSVWRLNPSARHFEADELPSQLAGLEEEVRQARSSRSSTQADSILANKFHEQSSPTQGRHAFADSFYRIGDPLTGWRFEPNIPVLVHRIAPDFSALRGKQSKNPESADWIVIELNGKVIQTQILPALTQTYFQGTDGLDYQVAVISASNPVHLIYSSDPDFGKVPILDADGTMDIFGRLYSNALLSPVQVFRHPSENRGPAASFGISWFPLLQEASEDQDWRLVVRHRRGGPLGAFVAEMHRRDLAISFGALLLLVINMAMLIATGSRAQQLARLQMDFVTAVSHELRTPLTVIRSAANNIAHGVVEGKQQLTHYAAAIETHAKQLSGLVDQILLFAGTRQGPPRHTLHLLQISPVVDAALASVAELIQTAHFSVERDIEPNLPLVMGEPVALSQCLQNLITNALKYGREQRWIGIRAGVNSPGTATAEIFVTISDRGSGIDSADLPHIFEPFYRSPSAMASQIHGTGLGLSVAKSIVEAMNGTLTVTSVPGSGSAFTLRIPCADHSVLEPGVEKNAAITS
jgi:signal transduction histidine kinase